MEIYTATLYLCFPVQNCMKAQKHALFHVLLPTFTPPPPHYIIMVKGLLYFHRNGEDVYSVPHVEKYIHCSLTDSHARKYLRERYDKEQ